MWCVGSITRVLFFAHKSPLAIYNVAVVAAVSFVTDVRLARRSFARDVLFFILTIIYLLIVTLDGVITLAEASGFAIIYILFITVVAGGRWIRALRTEDEGSSAFGSAGGEGPGSSAAAAAIADDHGLSSTASSGDSMGAFQTANPPASSLDAARRAALVASYQRAHNKVKQQDFFLQSPNALADGMSQLRILRVVVPA